MASYYLSNDNLHELVIRLLKTAAVIAPVEFNNRNVLEEVTVDNAAKINLFGYRTVEHFKSYFFPVTENASTYFDQSTEPKPKSLVLLGLRACDLSALEVTDKVFLAGDFCDVNYQARREKRTIITADCTDCGPTCFCTMVKGQPYATKGFDLNLSPVEAGFVVTIGSDKGEKLVQENKQLFLKANLPAGRQGNEETDKEKAEKKRSETVKKLEMNNQDFPLKKDLSLIHKMNLENKVWRMLTKDCVECSACNFACPTCTCFLLLDARDKRQDTKTKVWDGCLKNGYARVAGGANSRPKLYERLQNRYQCKFDYSFDRLGRYTCVGCGRCIDGCAGNIDMRKIFVELERQAPLTAKLE